MHEVYFCAGVFNLWTLIAKFQTVDLKLLSLILTHLKELLLVKPSRFLLLVEPSWNHFVEYQKYWTLNDRASLVFFLSLIYLIRVNEMLQVKNQYNIKAILK